MTSIGPFSGEAIYIDPSLYHIKDMGTFTNFNTTQGDKPFKLDQGDILDPELDKSLQGTWGEGSQDLQSQKLTDLLQMLLPLLTELLPLLKSGTAGDSSQIQNPDLGTTDDQHPGPSKYANFATTPGKTQGAAPQPSGQATSAGGGISNAASSANPQVGQWNEQIAAASKASGLDPNLIGAQIWAESRGNMNTHTQNVDGTTDHGLMQIGQERWNRDIVPHLSAEEKEKIQQATGKSADKLDVTQPLDNVVAGSFHIKHCIDKFDGNVDKGLRYYNTGDANGAGSSGYVSNVKEYMRELQAGEVLKSDPYSGANGTAQAGVV